MVERPHVTITKFKNMTPAERQQYKEALAEYSKQRFPKGAVFALNQDFFGRPKGSKCTVVNCWPQTRVEWWPHKNLPAVVADMCSDLDKTLKRIK